MGQAQQDPQQQQYWRQQQQAAAALQLTTVALPNVDGIAARVGGIAHSSVCYGQPPLSKHVAQRTWRGCGLTVLSLAH